VSYVDHYLNPGETVVHRTTLHPVIFVTGGLLGALGLLCLADSDLAGLWRILLIAAALAFGVAWLRYSNSEFAVTTTRVIIKVGWLNTRSVELQLAKVEALSVNQDLLGQVLDYGTLVVGGTGGTKEAFTLIKDPIAFRQAVQQQSEIASSRPAVAASPAPVAAPLSESRQERDCPYCAERILAKASRCRFCGQTVTPLA